MATYNGNEIHFTRNGIDLKAKFRDISYEVTVSEVDGTAGSGATTMASLAGLQTITIAGTLTYDNDPTIRASILSALKQGETFTTVFGPEGSVTGQPRYEGEMLSLGGQMVVSHDKQLVTIPFTLKAAGEPVAEINAGGVFA